MKVIWAWLLIALSYVSTFLPTMFAAYYFLAYEKMQEAGRGGLGYFIVVGVMGTALLFAIIKTVNAMRPNMFKSMFRTAVKVAIVLALLGTVRYIDFKLEELIKVIYVTLGGFTLGSLFELLAVGLFGDYIREVGVYK
jgi:hypothetical protein